MKYRVLQKGHLPCLQAEMKNLRELWLQMWFKIKSKRKEEGPKSQTRISKGKPQDKEQKRTVKSDEPLCDEQFKNVLEQCCLFSQFLFVNFFFKLKPGVVVQACHPRAHGVEEKDEEFEVDFRETGQLWDPMTPHDSAMSSHPLVAACFPC